MRGLPRPDLRLAFLRPEQVSEQLYRLEGREVDGNPDEANEDEDEDGVDADGIRDKFGKREPPPEEHDGSSNDLTMTDSDDSQLSEYHDRRRLRREEKDHERRRQRLGILRRSLRIERRAFHKSIPHHATADVPIGDDESGDRATEVRRNEDLDEVMRRYDERLACIDEEEERHARAVSRLFESRSLSVRQARIRRREREEKRRVFEARARAEEEHIQRARARAEAERARRDMEEERARARAKEAREEEMLMRHQRLWLSSTRSRARIVQRGRRVLGELDIAEYPVRRSGEVDFVELSDL